MLINNAIFPILYNSVYALTALIVVMSVLSTEINKDIVRQKKLGSLLVFIPLFLLIILVGFRDFNVGTDTYNYYNILWLTDDNIDYSSEFLFSLLAGILKYFNLTYSYFLFIIAFLFFSINYLALNKMARFYNSNIFYSFFVYFSFFFFLSLSSNVIRQGISLAFIILAYSFYLNKESKSKILSSLLISIAFHATAIIPIIIFMLSVKSRKYVKSKYLYFLFFLSIFVSFINIGLADISPFLVDILGSDNRRVGYLDGSDSDYVIGFKLQFVIFNIFFLFFALFVRSKVRNNLWVFNIDLLIRYYILTSCLFFMAFQLPFSDRWGLFSWISIPLFFIPLFSSKHVKNGIRIHWIFMLILMFIGFYLYVQN